MKRAAMMIAIAGAGLALSLSGGASGKPEAGAAVAGNASGLLLAAPDMNSARAAHSATALPDGRVLIAGGMAEQTSAVGAQVYLPDAGQFSALPDMVVRRQSHSATLLPGGQVLLVGGFGAETTTTTSAEIFDPLSNTFASTGSLRAPRAGHVAVLLDNGQVLIVGGVGPGWKFLSSAELYDPTLGKFTSTGSMEEARESHTAVRLPDGRVLVVGGHRGRRENIRIHASAEIYDPASGSFTQTSSLNIRRHKHDAIVLPDGQVLVSGGADERDDQGVYDTTELFNPETGIFSMGPIMNLGRYKHAGSSLLLPDGKILLAGGAPQAEVYEPVTQRFTLVEGEPRMAGQFSATALLPGGGALISGGYGNGTGPRSSAWLFQP